MTESADHGGRQKQPSMTRGERIRAAARTLRKPRTASWIADETDVSVKTAQKYLDQLVEDNVLRKIEQGDRALYCIDHLMATYREVAALQREHEREELTNALESMRTQIVEWKQTYGIERPGELRASIAELDAADEAERRRKIANEWEHLEDRLPVIQTALTEYDWANERDAISA